MKRPTIQLPSWAARRSARKQAKEMRPVALGGGVIGIPSGRWALESWRYLLVDVETPSNQHRSSTNVSFFGGYVSWNSNSLYLRGQKQSLSMLTLEKKPIQSSNQLKKQGVPCCFQCFSSARHPLRKHFMRGKQLSTGCAKAFGFSLGLSLGGSMMGLWCLDEVSRWGYGRATSLDRWLYDILWWSRCYSML